MFFGAETVRWLVQNREALTDDETSSVLRWAVHEQLERRLNGNQVKLYLEEALCRRRIAICPRI